MILKRLFTGQSFAIITLGCKVNQYESERYFEALTKLGFFQKKQDADICIINTCAVTEKALKESDRVIRNARKQHPRAKIYVTGCLTEEDKKNYPDVVFVPNAEKEKLVQFVFPESNKLKSSFSLKAHTRAFLKIQDGCDNFCSYCIVPYRRGRSRSRVPEEIISEARQIVDAGFKEIVLVGINLGDYAYSLSELMKSLSRIDGLERIRLSSINPDDVDASLLKVLLEEEKVMPSLHMSLQSGSNKILQKMRRKYTAELFLEKIAALKARQGFVFTTDVIIGFPGEEEEDFQATLKILENVEFLNVHIFTFSARKGTLAYDMAKVSPQIVKKRRADIEKMVLDISLKVKRSFLSTRVNVLLEEDGAVGHSENFLPVKLQNFKLARNEIVNVELSQVQDGYLVGKL